MIMTNFTTDSTTSALFSCDPLLTATRACTSIMYISLSPRTSFQCTRYYTLRLGSTSSINGQRTNQLASIRQVQLILTSNNQIITAINRLKQDKIHTQQHQLAIKAHLIVRGFEHGPQLGGQQSKFHDVLILFALAQYLTPIFQVPRALLLPTSLQFPNSNLKDSKKRFLPIVVGGCTGRRPPLADGRAFGVVDTPLMLLSNPFLL